MWRGEFFDPLAWAYYKSGDLENARLQWMNYLYAHSFYMLGKIYEQKGEKSKARADYQKFLEIWKDADPGLPPSRRRPEGACHPEGDVITLSLWI
jgi:tetratricopeptide (TPR) repeat protein